MRETARTTTRPRRRRSLGDGGEREERKGESKKKNRKKKDKRMISQALFKEEKKRKIGDVHRDSQSLLFRTCPYFFWAIFTARSSMISSLPPGMAKALTSLYSLSTFSPCPPLT